MSDPWMTFKEAQEEAEKAHRIALETGDYLDIRHAQEAAEYAQILKERAHRDDGPDTLGLGLGW